MITESIQPTIDIIAASIPNDINGFSLFKPIAPANAAVNAPRTPNPVLVPANNLTKPTTTPDTSNRIDAILRLLSTSKIAIIDTTISDKYNIDVKLIIPCFNMNIELIKPITVKIMDNIPKYFISFSI